MTVTLLEFFADVCEFVTYILFAIVFLLLEVCRFGEWPVMRNHGQPRSWRDDFHAFDAWVATSNHLDDLEAS